MFKKTIKTGLMATMLIGATITPTLASDVDDAITIRKVMMGSLRWSGMGVMGAQTDSKKQQQDFVGLARQFVASAEAIPLTFKMKALGKDSSVKTKVSDNESIWTDWDGYMKQADQMANDAKAVLKLAQAGDYAGAKKAAGAAFKNNCKACHDKYQD